VITNSLVTIASYVAFDIIKMIFSTMAAKLMLHIVASRT